MPEWVEITLMIIASLLLLTAAVYLVIHQRTKIISWLKYATMEAEKQLGTKTGQAKLYTVYGWFCKQFPKLATVLPFAWFSKLVDIALDTFKDWYENNKFVNAYVKEGENGVIYK